MLSAVSGGSMSIIVGIVIVAIVSWLIATFGLAVFGTYERYAITSSSNTNLSIFVPTLTTK